MKQRSMLLMAALGLAGVSAQAQSQTAYTDVEVAYVAAKWLQADFARDDALCSRREYRKALAGSRTDFERTHPEYAVALALASPRQEVAEVTKRKLEAFAKIQLQMEQMLMQMPPAEFQKLCERVVAQRSVTDFAKRVATTREMLGRDVPPAPEPPITSLASEDVAPVVAAVLQHKRVAMYLHPEVPGRVPVRVAVAAPYDRAALDVQLYGAPVKRMGTGDRDAVQLTLQPHDASVKVKVEYRPEGIFGTVELEKRDGVWHVTDAKIFE